LNNVKKIKVIDSHTGGEPTRVVPIGEIPLEGSTMAERLGDFSTRWDHLRQGILWEPRGYEAMVGAILSPPTQPHSAAGVIFCNNVSYLGMCGHGSIGVVQTLNHLGLIGPGTHGLDTPVGTVQVELMDSGEVAIENVRSYRHAEKVRIHVDGVGSVEGDVAYGGNWFFIVYDSPIALELGNEPELRNLCKLIKTALASHGICGNNRAEIDHIELCARAPDETADSVNYVLCPGNAYDRSPCGTGTSAKLACLVEDGKIDVDEWYTQQSITGSKFRGTMRRRGEYLIPTIVGQAWITGESTLLFDESDPIRWGFQ
jgi:4-hydroxyproline epimerase